MPLFCTFWILFLISSIKGVNGHQAEIRDPLNIFCGSQNCYDILQIASNATLKDVKKAYRAMTLLHHPDKSSSPNATAIFRAITKAHEVLTNNVTRESFDYYLAHPNNYFAVSGQHLMRSAPKTNIAVVLAVFLLLMSWLNHTIQYQKYERVVKFLKSATLNNLAVGIGGTKQSVELYRRASVLYSEHMQSLPARGAKRNIQKRPHKDPLFERFVDQVVSEVKVEGGYSKPELKDFLAVQLVLLPRSFYRFVIKVHRRYISTEPLPMADRVDMTIAALGFALWNEFSDAEQVKLVEMELWIKENFSKWMEQRQAGMILKTKKMARKHAKRGVQLERDEDQHVE